MINRSENLRTQLGPLTDLVGVWEGDKGGDVAPSEERGIAKSDYRERLVLEPLGPIQNHEQNLHVLRYSTKAWRIGSPDPFHEELGYWSWEPANQELLRCFLIPRGISVIAGGKVGPDAREFTLRSAYGSNVFGICVNPFLDREFRIVSYEVSVRIHDLNRFSYESDTVMKLPDQSELFHHRDKNTL